MINLALRITGTLLSGALYPSDSLLNCRFQCLYQGNISYGAYKHQFFCGVLNLFSLLGISEYDNNHEWFY